MLEIYLKTCNFYVAKNKFDMEYGRKKRFTTAEPELVLLDIGNPEVQKHLDMGVYRGEGFDSLWKFLKGTKHTDMENNLLCFSELRKVQMPDGVSICLTTMQVLRRDTNICTRKEKSQSCAGSL